MHVVSYVERSWARLDAWLTLEAITAAEQATGVAFPSDLRASLAHHDGECLDGVLGLQYAVLPHAPLLSTTALVDSWQLHLSIPELADDYDRRWIPLGENEGFGWLVDLRPDGQYGSVFWWDHLTYAQVPEQRFTSVAGFLDAVAEAVTASQSLDRWTPAPDIATGRMDWEPVRSGRSPNGRRGVPRT